MTASPPLRIALTVNFSPWSPYSGGGQRSTHNVATELAALGHDVTVIYTKAFGERISVPAELTYKHCFARFPALRSHSSALLRPVASAAVYHQLRQLSLQRPFDIVHGNGDEAALNDRLKEFGTRAVVTPRFPSLPRALSDGSWRSSPKRWLYALKYSRYAALGRALRAAQLYCPTSEASAEEMARAYQLPLARSRVIPNGVAPVYHQQERSAKRGPALFFGRLSNEKGVGVLLQALKLLGVDAPALDVIGRGPLRGALVNAAVSSELRYDDWLSPQQIADRLSRARYVVLPSLEESFGNAVAESLVVGTPVISTTAGSIPELVEHEVTGLLVPPGDAGALAAAIRRFEKAPSAAAQMGQQGRVLARERYSWKSTAERYVTVYREALSSRLV